MHQLKCGATVCVLFRFDVETFLNKVEAVCLYLATACTVLEGGADRRIRALAQGNLNILTKPSGKPPMLQSHPRRCPYTYTTAPVLYNGRISSARPAEAKPPLQQH